MNTKDIEYFKKKLEVEKARLESELAGIGRRDKASPGGWDATAGGLEVDAADENELADKMEEMEDNSSIVTNLETQLNEVTAALDRIEKGTYGTDEATGKPIERERLEANPSARNSLKK
jgi:RNA polymerase-binding transcription factor DksA